MKSHFFDKINSIPIFQGLSSYDFMTIADRVYFDFKTLPPNTIVVKEGDLCEQLICSISGTLSRDTRCDNGSYRFREFFNQPIVIQPERLFGLRPRYSSTFETRTEVQLLCISKLEVRDTLFTLMPFHINYLNAICSLQQVWENHLFHSFPPTLLTQFVRFVQQRAQRPAGRKELFIDMSTLAKELTTTRLNISKMLNHLEQHSLVELHRCHIIIPTFESLIQYAQ